MRECTVLRRSRGPVFTLHQSVVWSDCQRRIDFRGCPSPSLEGAASGDKTLEVIDMRRLQIRSCWLIVAAILIEPWNRVGCSKIAFGLDEPAEAAIEKWEFAPGMKDGVPVNVVSIRGVPSPVIFTTALWA